MLRFVPFHDVWAYERFGKIAGALADELQIV